MQASKKAASVLELEVGLERSPHFSGGRSGAADTGSVVKRAHGLQGPRSRIPHGGQRGQQGRRRPWRVVLPHVAVQVNSEAQRGPAL